MSSEEVKRARVLISGRVQGVFFRFETRDIAQSLGLGGWVRNLPDGSVEAVFEGKKEAVEKAIEWCRRGPSLAQVKDVQVDWERPEGETDFAIRYL